LFRQTYRAEIIKKLRPFLRGTQKNIVFLVCLSLLSIGFSFATPVFYKLFVDEVIIARKLDMFLVVAAGYLSVFFLSTAVAYLRTYFGNRLQNRLLFKIKDKILRNYLSMPFGEYEKRNTSDLKMRIDEDCFTLSGFVEVQNVDYLKSLITAAIATVLMMWIEWKLALFSILVIPLTFFLDHKLSLREKKLMDTNRINDENWYNRLQTSIQGWKEVKALNLQKREKRNFVRYAHNFAEYFGRWIYYWVLRALIIPRIKDEFLMKFALYFFGGLLVMRKDITIGDLLVFSVYYELLSNSVRTVSSANAELQSHMPIYNRVLEALSSERCSVHGKLSCTFPKNGELELREVSFSYDGGRSYVIRNFSLSVQKGERVAIVGPSGSGKTTLLKLIAGILEPDAGSVRFSGVDVRHLDPKWYYQKIGFVMQEHLLLNLSIRDNLLLAHESADDRLLDEACKKACIYDFVQSLPEKYDTLIGEKGVKLSGGQRQRLALARLFLRDPDVLIFDEATSALDPYSEKIIHDAIQTLGRDKTILIVSHRESSIALCDRVVRIA
jgi:ATP-binding cassette subfamily B protein/subfamily B ATP-binding cassette protein MsbA